MSESDYMASRYRIVVAQSFLDDLQFIRDNELIASDDWELFRLQLKKEQLNLDQNWEAESKAAEFEPLSTYGYRKRYMHSIPEKVKIERHWLDRKADFRIVFKVREDQGELLYFGIGKRIKGIPKDPHDIWSILRQRAVPEENESAE